MANMKLKCTRSKVVQINLFLKSSPTSSADALDSVDFPLETRMKKKSYILTLQKHGCQLILSILFIFILGLHFTMVDPMKGAVNWWGLNYKKEVHVHCYVQDYLSSNKQCDHIQNAQRTKLILAQFSTHY